jgi:DNA-binding transcriptional LysR family regulator
MDKYNLLTVLIKSVQCGSFSAAAAVLGQSPSTISKAISKLEVELGIKIFDRNTRYLRLTDVGEVYYNRVCKLIHELEVCEQELRKDRESPQGLLRINMPIAYGRLYINKALSLFTEKYPDIGIEATYADHHLNIIENGFDITIRTGKLENSGLIAKTLSPLDFLICGSPDFFAQHGVPRTQSALTQLPWIFFRFSESGRLMPIKVSDSFEFKKLRQSVITVNDAESMVEFCLCGKGLIQAPHFLVGEHIRAGRLQMLLPPLRKPDFGVYAIFKKEDKDNIKIRVFINFLKDFLEDWDERPEGTWTNQLVPLVSAIEADSSLDALVLDTI